MNNIEERRQTIHLMQPASERGRQVQTKAIHMYVQHPIAQAIHDQLQGARVQHV
jgi:hypothetical protein